MGIGDAVGDAVLSSANSYQGFFRFNAELAKGLSVGEGFMQVLNFSGGPLSKPVYLSSTDDQSLLLGITAARSYGFLRIHLLANDSYQGAISALQELRTRKVPVAASLGVTRYAFGKPAERFILKDRAAKILDIGYEMGLISSAHVIRMEMPSPELFHGFGERVKVKKV